MPAIWLPVNKVLRLQTKEEAARTLDAMPTGCAVLSGRDVVIVRAVNMEFTLATSAPTRPVAGLAEPLTCVDDLYPAHDRQTCLPRQTRHVDR